MGRRIVFYGNCQAGTLAHLYRDQLSDGDDQVDAIFFRDETDEENVNLLRAAHIVVEQIFDGPNDIVSRNISPTARAFPIP